MFLKKFLNWLKRKFTKPEKLMDEYIMKLLDDLVEVKIDTSFVIGQEKKARIGLEEINNRIPKLQNYAEQAVIAGNDEDARQFLEEKSRQVAKRDAAAAKYSQAKEYADRMRAMHDALVDQVEELRQKRQQIKTKIALAEAQEEINELNGRMSKVHDMRQVYEQMEEKADRRMDEANAYARLDHTMLDEQLEELKVKYGEA